MPRHYLERTGQNVRPIDWFMARLRSGDVQKVPVKPAVGGQLRVEGNGQQAALPGRHGPALGAFPGGCAATLPDGGARGNIVPPGAAFRQPRHSAGGPRKAGQHFHGLGSQVLEDAAVLRESSLERQYANAQALHQSHRGYITRPVGSLGWK